VLERLPIIRSRRTAIASVLASVAFTATATPTAAATVTAAYLAGHRDVTINDYHTDGLGAFELDTGGERLLAWCIEAHVAHTTRPNAYRAVPTESPSADLDTLVWILERSAPLDDDTATAGAALAWWYSGARRSIGPAVWSDGSTGFTPVSPFEPHDWSALPPLSASQPVGLRSGSADLDAAERRVVELHRAVTAWRGPWQIGLDELGRIEVRGPNGPIGGIDVEVILRAPGEPESVVTATTDQDGRATVPVDLGDSGGDITAMVQSPGPHQEWDGDGDTQRLVTATTDVVETSVRIAAPLRHLTVEKSSKDPTIGVSGATFEIRDRDGLLVERLTTERSGTVQAAPIDPSVHPPPYLVVETEAPVGLALADPVQIADASTDADHPTVVRIVDQPLHVDVVVRKRLSIPAVGPTDRSGFQFTVARAVDGATHRAITDSDGTTPAIELALGTYRVCETGVPPWADLLVDDGCRDLTIGPDDLARGAVITVDYLNRVVGPSIDTWVVDPTGAGRLVDRVELDGTIPATRYRVTGAIVDGTGRPTGITRTLEFEADSHRTELHLEFDVTELPPGTYVVIEDVDVITADGAEAVRVAGHGDLTDPDQTFTIVAPDVGSSIGTTPSLPTTGADSDLLRQALGIADVTFVLGAALGVVASLRRSTRI
jgi:hypothetical protein